jgi:hypothetical protein
LTSPTVANGYRMQARAATGGTTSSKGDGSTGAAPIWLKLVRAGNLFSAFASSTGADGDWKAITDPVTVTMPQSILVGLAVTSHTEPTTATAVFDNVSVR